MILNYFFLKEKIFFGMTTDFSITRIRTRTDYDGDYDMENGKFFQFFQGIQQLFIQMDGGGSSWNEAVL